MKKIIVLTLLGLTSLGSFAQSQGNVRNFYVGTYTDGQSKGIYYYGVDLKTGKLYDKGLAAEAKNPSFLALSKDGKSLLAVHETADPDQNGKGSLELFKIGSAGKLTPVNKVASGGLDPCYVSANKEGFVAVANYSSGSASLYKLEGRISDPLSVVQHFGVGPNKDRQEKAHAHSAFFEPGGKRIFVADLGIDRVKVYEIAPETNQLTAAKYPEIALPAGSGPRHLAFNPAKKMLYVVNELTSSVSVVELKPDGSYNLLSTVSALANTFKRANTCADIHLSSDGRFLYVSNRGANTIAIFSVSSNGKVLKQIDQVPVHGETPRNFTLSPDGSLLLVANQNSNNIVSFKRNSKNGKLTFLDSITAQKPVCLLFEK